MGTSPFKANYSYKPITSLILQQVIKISETAKERVETLINLYKNLYKTVKLVQERMKKYYNLKKSKGLDLKKGDKVWLLYKNFKLRRLSKKLNHIKIGPFKITERILEVMYKLDLLVKIKIYPVQHIAMLEPVYGDLALLVYKEDTYRGQEEDK